MTPSLSRSRVAELDGIRGVAILMVLVWHFVGALIDHDLGSWSKLLSSVTIFGRTGVDLFFVLSGFLITGILLDRNRSSLLFLRSFYIRRFLRIVPSYLLLVAVFWGIVSLGVSNSAFNGDTPFWHHATFTQNWWMSFAEQWGPGAISVTWSVAIEAQFYLVFPLLILITPRQKMPTMFLIVAVGSALFRAVAWLNCSSAFTMYVHTLSRLDGLVAGAWVAWVWRHKDFNAYMSPHNQNTLRRSFKALVWTLPVFLVALKVNLPWTMAIWGHTYLTLLYALTLLLVIRSLSTGGIPLLRKAWLAQLGAVSYTVYLFHPFFLTCTFLLAGRAERISSLQDIVLASGSLCATLLWASISLKFFERPLHILAAHFTTDQPYLFHRALYERSLRRPAPPVSFYP